MRTTAVFLIFFGMAIMPAGAANPPAPPKIHKVFDVFRGSDKIGTDTIDIERQNDTTRVKVKTDISVKIMFIEAYRYEHSRNEVWKKGQLVTFKSRTNDNGTKHSVEVTAANDKLNMEVDGEHSDLPTTAAPASLWDIDVIHRSDTFDPDTGKRYLFKVSDLGPDSVTINGVTHQAHHYKITDTLAGEFARDLWFDGEVLLRIKLIGSDSSVILSDLR